MFQPTITPEIDHYAVSPDGRYLAIGKQSIHVWDLTGLMPDVRYRAPIHRKAIADHPIAQLRFVDNACIEVTDVRGNLQVWDVATGHQIALG